MNCLLFDKLHVHRHKTHPIFKYIILTVSVERSFSVVNLVWINLIPQGYFIFLKHI